MKIVSLDKNSLKFNEENINSKIINYIYDYEILYVS